MNNTSERKVVSVIVPVRDEANSIGNLIPKIKESLAGLHHEIIVVDDGSRDGTREIARNNGTIVVSHEKNLGKGAAMKTGVQNASGLVFVFLDGDGAHDPRDIPTVVAPILQARSDFIIGSRALLGSTVHVSPLIRRLCNSLASLFISVIVSFVLPVITFSKSPIKWKWIRITDCTSGFRAIRRESWYKMSLISQGFQIETEMIYEGVRRSLIIGEAPIDCHWDSRRSRLSILRDGSKTLLMLTRKILFDIIRRR